MSFVPASVFAVLSDETWTDKSFHTDQDEAPKISYHKAYSYLAKHEYETYDDAHPYPVRGVNSPVPIMLNADDYPDGNGDVDYWRATEQSPYFAVSYKMTITDTFDHYLGTCWNNWTAPEEAKKVYNIPEGETLGGSDQGWYYYGSYNEVYPRMGISLGQAWNSTFDKNTFSQGYSYGFFGFGYSNYKKEEEKNVVHYSTPYLMFGPTGYEGNNIDSNWLEEENPNPFKSPFFADNRAYPLDQVPVYDRDGNKITKDFTNQENVIMLVGSYINNNVVLKAYINGYQISEIWGGGDTFTFTDKLDTHTMWGEEWNFTFGGQVGFINQLNRKFAYARFTRSSHELDQNAFNVHHAKVDASRPNDNNPNYYYDQANQWKVDKKNFAASYTIKIDENKNYSYVDGGKDILATSLNCGLVFGRQSRDPDNLLGTIDFRFSKTGEGTCKWDSNSKLWFGPDNLVTANATGTLGLNWRRSEIKYMDYSGTNNGTTVKNNDTGIHVLLITGTYDKGTNTAKIKVWLDGEQIATWFPEHDSKKNTDEKEQTIKNFGNGLNYIGWRTNVKGVDAVARFTQWDVDANMDYAAENGTVFDLKTAGPMTGYWDRKVNQNALNWGADKTDTFDSVNYTPYNEAWEGYEYPNSNTYQLGMITDPSRSFVVQADIPYSNLKGFYITPEKPTDETNDGLNIGFSDGGMDDVRKWYNKYYYIQLRADGAITTWINMGDGDPAETRWLWPDVHHESRDVLNVDNVINLNPNEDVGVRVVYNGGKLSIYVKEGGESKDDTNYKFLYSFNNLTGRNAVWIGHDVDFTGAQLWDSDFTGPLYFGLMTKSGENSGDGNTGVTFKNVKVSYGLQSPTTIHGNNNAEDNKLTTKETTAGDIVYSVTGAGGKNTNVAGFAQTRSGQTEGTYDLRVAVEGNDLGLYRKENYDAVIRVEVQKGDGSDKKTILSYSHHWAYREFSFYDAEYYFHACDDDHGLICAVFTNIPEDYTNYRVYVDFYERNEKDIKPENVKVSVYLGQGNYDARNNTLHGAGGSPAPSLKNGTVNVDKELDKGLLSYRYGYLHGNFPTYYGYSS